MNDETHPIGALRVLLDELDRLGHPRPSHALAFEVPFTRVDDAGTLHEKLRTCDTREADHATAVTLAQMAAPDGPAVCGRCLTIAVEYGHAASPDNRDQQLRRQASAATGLLRAAGDVIKLVRAVEGPLERPADVPWRPAKLMVDDRPGFSTQSGAHDFVVRHWAERLISRLRDEQPQWLWLRYAAAHRISRGVVSKQDLDRRDMHSVAYGSAPERIGILDELLDDVAHAHAHDRVVPLASLKPELGELRHLDEPVVLTSNARIVALPETLARGWVKFLKLRSEEVIDAPDGWVDDHRYLAQLEVALHTWQPRGPEGHPNRIDLVEAMTVAAGVEHR